MYRMEVACLVIILFVAVLYVSVKRQKTYIHNLFLGLMVCSIINLVFDMVTLYTVNHIREIPQWVNHVCHQIFIGSLVIVLYMTFKYILLLIDQDIAKPKKPSRLWYIPLVVSLLGVIFMPLKYMETPAGNYSYGIAANMAYMSVGFYVIVSIIILIRYWNRINPKKRVVILLALGSQFFVSVYQAIFPLSLLSGLGVTMLNLSFYLTVESSDVHLIERLREERERADLANKTKSSFIANVSHEIRTPINAVLGMDEMILRESKEDAIKKYAFGIKSAAHTLLGLINDILDVSKIESGKMEIVPDKYNTGIMLHDIMNMINLKAKAKELTMITDIDPNIPSQLYGDDVRIKQILTNILTNAVKYTREGSVTLRGKVVKREQDMVTIRYTVSDTGIGIKEEDLSKLFVAFERIEESRNRNIEGTGLGMSITLQLLKLMGSTLQVESTYGTGSDFSFEIEQKVLDDKPLGDFEHDIMEQNQTGEYEVSFISPNAKILVVDDNEMNRKVFANFLKETKISVEEAASGRACIDMIRKTHYDLIFMDHMMPEMDGIETLEHMLHMQDQLCKGTPVIILTANAVAGSSEMYLSKGFANYLAKPIVPKQLEQMIAEMLPPELVISGENITRNSSADKIKNNSSDEMQNTNQSSSMREIVTTEGRLSETSGYTKGSSEPELFGADIYRGTDTSDSDADIQDNLCKRLEGAYGIIDGIDWHYTVIHMPDYELLVYTLQMFCEIADEEMAELDALYQQIDDPKIQHEYCVKVHGTKSSAALIGAVSLSGIARLLEKESEAGNIEAVRRMHLSLMKEWMELKECLATKLAENE